MKWNEPYHDKEVLYPNNVPANLYIDDVDPE